MLNKRHFSTLFIAIVLSIALTAGNLTDLLQTDQGGNLHSHMELAAYHGYDVAPHGIVTIDGNRYEIWPEVRHVS